MVSDLYVSWPSFQEFDHKGAAIHSPGETAPSFLQISSDAIYTMKTPGELHSEFVTGVRFDYLDSWQMNVRIKRGFAGASTDHYLPLFWIGREPPTLNPFIQRFSNLAEYQSSMLTLCFGAYALQNALLFLVLGILFYATGCVQYMKNADEKWKPFKPVYLT